MKNSTLGFSWLCSAVLVLAYVGVLYWLLPEEVAHHFDFQGQPDAWGDRDTHLSLLAGLIALMNLGIWGLWAFLEKIPPEMISTPWPSYWRASPERFAEFCQLNRRILLGTGCFQNIVLGWVLGSIHAASLDPPVEWVSQPLLWVVLGGSILFVAWTLLVLRPPSSPTD